ncbi:MAG TPA: hypothetical protein VNT25_08130 [Allosphingosinicella sp.]|nr:hypothetical protein [Allosphingosinicella sp.]
MPAPLSVSALTALTLAGAGLGVYLGKSAISEINPAYFSSPFSGSSFHADLAANRTPFTEQASLAPVQAMDSFVAYSGGCIGCAVPPPTYVPVSEPLRVPSSSYASVAADIEQIEDEVDKAVRDAQKAVIERYAHYPVSAEEARAAVEKRRDVETGSGCADSGSCTEDGDTGI